MFVYLCKIVSTVYIYNMHLQMLNLNTYNSEQNIWCIFLNDPLKNRTTDLGFRSLFDGQQSLLKDILQVHPFHGGTLDIRVGIDQSLQLVALGRCDVFGGIGHTNIALCACNYD